MVKTRKAQDIGLQVGEPEYWELLTSSLHKAKDLLWKRLQYGQYKDDNEARAVMDAYWALKKVVELQETKIRQIPLPIKDGEEVPPALIYGEPQEVASDPAPGP